MANLLLESSAFTKFFQPEEGSEKVISLVDDPNNCAFVSWLTLVEFPSALMRRVRMGEITEADFKRVRRNLYAHLRLGRFRIVLWSIGQVEDAILLLLLLLRYGNRFPLRALDALPLAVALDMKAQGILDFFVCADETLCEVAEKEGISVINPLKAP